MSEAPSLLGGRYRLLRPLGAGGVATVHLAHDERVGREVAVKILRVELIGSHMAERFLQEAELTARLAHPGIVPVFDSGREGRTIYFVMPYEEGESLAERLERERQLPVGEAVRLAREVAEALDYAHRHGVVHRDIKPSNILLSDGRALVSDFGIAKALLDSENSGPNTSAGVAVGSPAYMSPEQYGDGGEVDRRTDVYLLGCVLFEMLTGEPPFRGATRLALMAKHLAEPPPLARTVRPTVPEELDEVIATALAKVPADRFSSAAEFAEALGELEREGVVDRIATRSVVRRRGKASARARAARLGKRRLRATLLGAGLLVVAALALWRLGGPSGTPLDPNTVMIFPLGQQGEGDEGALVGVFLASVLVHVEPLRFRDAWSFLAAEQKVDIRTLSRTQARELARSRRAAFYVDGMVVPVGDSVTVSLTLWDVAGDSVLDRATARGPDDGVPAPQLGLHAMIRLLPALVPAVPTEEFEQVLGRDARAIALWIQGEREYRQAAFRTAFDLLEAAVATDSLLALAALRAAQAAGWTESPERGDELARLALRHEVHLPLRHRALARGFLAYVEGRADDAVRDLRAATARDRGWPEAWTLLGETYHHLLPEDVVPDSSAITAFEQAARADSTFIPALIHLAERAARTGDLDRADVLLERIEGAGADEAAVAFLRLMIRCRADGVDGVDWRGAVSVDPNAVIAAGKLLAAGGASPHCAEAALRATYELAGATNERWGALQGLQGVLVQMGRVGEARELLEEAASQGGMPAARLFHILDAFVAPSSGESADSVVAWARDATAGSFVGPQPRSLWLIGAWLARRRAHDELARVTTALTASAGPDNPLLLASLAGHTALSHEEVERARTFFEALSGRGSRIAIGYDIGAGFPVERMVLACLHLGAGRPREAFRAARGLDHPQPMSFLPFVPASLAVRAEAAQRMGESALAVELERRLRHLGREGLSHQEVCSSLPGGVV